MKANTVLPWRYSPHPPSCYGADIFKLLVQDSDAWNLAYLSWNWEGGTLPGASFSTDIVRTLLAYDLRMRDCLRTVPPRAVYRIARLPMLRASAMSQTYGQTWVDTMEARSRVWREPHHETLDYPVNDFTHALEVIRKL